MKVSDALRQTANETHDTSAPRPEFQAALRQRLLAVAATQGIGVTANETQNPATQPKPPMSGGRRMIVASALAVGVLGLSGVSTASADALPGDALYPVKRSAERAQLALAGSEVNRGHLFFEFARTRLDEAGRVSGDPEALNTALSAMDSQLTSGMKSLTRAAVNRQDAGVLDTIDEFLDGQSPKLAELLDDAPNAAQNTVGDSMNLMDSAAERSQELREALLCAASTDTDTDKLGPLPGECGVLPGEDGTPLDVPSEDSPDNTHSTTTGETEADASSPSTDTETPSPQSGGQQGGKKSDKSPSPTSPSPTGENGGGLLGEIGDTLDDLLG